MKKLRLVLFEQCNRRCKGCCNKDWNIKGLPVCDSYDGWDVIMLTGGEPMLMPGLVLLTISDIRRNPNTKVYVYTAKVDDNAIFLVLDAADGLTVTLHTQSDVAKFKAFDRYILPPVRRRKSLRLNIFKGVDLKGYKPEGWVIKDGIEWIKNCPLPEGETLMRSV